MSQDSVKKCSYYNSGYCKYSKKENGCKKYHPTESCAQINCKNQGCPLRHPKKCKFLEKCIFQKRCCYKHEKEPTKEDKIIAEEKELNNLKSEISLLKRENDDKINILAKVHLGELNEIRNENKLLIEDLKNAKEQLALKEAIIVSAEENNKMAVERLKKLEDENNVKITSLGSEVEYLKEEVKRLNKTVTDDTTEHNLIVRTHTEDLANAEKEITGQKETINSLKQQLSIMIISKKETKDKKYIELEREINRLKFNYNILEVTLAKKDKLNTEANRTLSKSLDENFSLMNQLATIRKSKLSNPRDQSAEDICLVTL